MLLSAMALVDLSMLVVGALQLVEPSRRLEQSIALVCVAHALGLFVTAVPFIAWLRRCYVNLDAFGHGRLQTPGWATFVWFVPLANLYYPYQIACELWNASDPDTSRHPDPLASPAPIGLWWAAWLGGRLAWQFVLRPASRGPTTEIVAAIVDLVAAALAIFVVHQITERQVKRAAQGASLAKVFE